MAPAGVESGAREIEVETMEVGTSGPGELFPPSYGQRALWFLQKLAPSLTAYNLRYAGRVTPPLSGATWRRAFQALADRPAVLRTTYPMVEGRPWQWIQPRRAIDFEEVDAAAWSEAEVDERLAREAQTPFDLENGPVVRLRVLGRDADHAVVFFSLHHVAADLFSIAHLLDELGLFLAVEESGEQVFLDEPEAHPGDFARWEESFLAGDGAAEQWAYWTARLADLPPLDLPTDRPRPPARRFRGDVLRFALGEPRARLRALAEAERVGFEVVLLALFQVLLGSIGGRDEVVLGWPAPGRPEPRFEKTVGYFINPIVLRGTCDRTRTFRRHVDHARQVLDEALEKQNLPFPLLVERLLPKRDSGRSPLYQVLLTLVDDADARLARLFGGGAGGVELGPVTFEPRVVSRAGAMLDLAINGIDAGGTLTIGFEWDTDLFERATVEGWAERCRRLFAAAAADPDRSLDELVRISMDGGS
jgi:hypothetical protein